jgi:hypothetical protein
MLTIKNNPLAWQRIGDMHAWPQVNQTGEKIYELTFNGAPSEFLNAAADTVEFGGATHGVKRPANTLTWAVYTIE